MQYVVGLDYGTLSARAIVVDVTNGRILGEKSEAYPHGVLENALPNGQRLMGTDWALADPLDYWYVLPAIVRGAVQEAGVKAQEVGALAIAATACTLMPVTADLTPLCALSAFSDRPHAYAKLWKHHRAQPHADAMTEAAQTLASGQLADYGGRISSEWAIPKVLEVLAEDAEIYRAADRFMQFSDWLTARLTGCFDVQNGSIATYKAMWSSKTGHPADTYLDAVDSHAREIVHQKLRGRKLMAGSLVGSLTVDAAEMLGLLPGTAIGMGHTDAHAAALGVGVAGEGDYAFIMGTSSCGHLLAKKKVRVPGVTGSLEDGLLPGYTCYSAGQACVGDMLDWFIRRAVPAEYVEEAAAAGGLHALLEEKAAQQRPGDNGLIALDWWNGNRSTLVDANLSGLLLGLTMDTKPEDIYRALLDSIAFGHLEILENFRKHGLMVNNITLCGGIVGKNELLLQIMADVLNQPLNIAETPQATALGAAICAATALNVKNGGYASLADAIQHMKSHTRKTVRPCYDDAQSYRRLYAVYHRLYDFFGRENASLMATLRHRCI